MLGTPGEKPPSFFVTTHVHFHNLPCFLTCSIFFLKEKTTNDLKS